MWPNLPWEISTCACGWTALYPWNAETPVFVWAIDVYVYSSELWRLEFRACDCVSMWGPAPSGYMSSSTPSRTRRRRVSSCMCTGSVEGQQPAFSRKLANEQLALRVSPDKQMVTVCTQGKCYQAVIISQAAICPPNRSQKGSKGGRRGEEKKALSFPSPNRHPVKSYVWFSFLSVPWRVYAVILCECHSFFPFIFIYLLLFFPLTWTYRLLPSFPLTAVQTTCYPSCPTWLCGVSVLSWCLNALLWRSSFMKGESSAWKVMMSLGADKLTVWCINT